MPSDHNSLLYWYPEIKDYFPTPKTWTLSPANLIGWMDNGIPDEWLARIKKLIEGKYPVFFRTDHASNKHEWKESCIIHHEREIKLKISRTLDFNYSVDLWPQHLVFRELLKPYGGSSHRSWGGFDAFGGFPVGRELRFFIAEDKVQCVHRYWLHEVFVKDRWAARTVPRDWDSRWKKLYDIPASQISMLSGRIENDFSPALKTESWSVDFMYASRGNSGVYQWFLIDMALAPLSYHPDHSSDMITPGGRSIVEMNPSLETDSSLPMSDLIELEPSELDFKSKGE